MADFYCDHGAYVDALGSEPTWGVPQEGDGFSPNPATSASVAEIRILASPTASETITIAGATITAGASLGTNIFARGANPGETAANIAMLINSGMFTATVGSGVAHNVGIAPTANQGRNMFYARVKPEAANTVQIMFRIGSEALNHANNSNVAITSSGWATPPTITQFSGGTSGCFGWFFNSAALGPGSSIAAATYGVMMSKPTVVRGATPANSVFALSEADIIWNRSGVGKLVSFTIPGNTSRVANANNYHIRTDSNTKWTSDPGDGVFEFRITNNANAVRVFSVVHDTCTRGKLSAERQSGFLINGRIMGGSGSALIFGTNVSTGLFEANNITIAEDPTSVRAGFSCVPTLEGATGNIICRDTVFSMLRSSTTARTLIGIGTTTASQNYEFDNCEFRFNYTGTAPPSAPLFTVRGDTSTRRRCRISGGRITGLGAYTQPVFGASTAWASTGPVEVIAEGLFGSDVGVNGLAPWGVPGGGSGAETRRVFVSVPTLGGSWRYETMTGAADWVNDGSFPTLNGRTPGNIPHSMRMYWLPGAEQDRIYGFIAPPLRQQSRGADGTKTIVVELFVPSSIAFDPFNLSARLRYVDTTNQVRLMTLTGANLATSSATWNNTSAYPGHVARRLTYVTAHPVRQYTEITVEIGIYGPSPTGSMAFLFVDPGFTVS